MYKRLLSITFIAVLFNITHLFAGDSTNTSQSGLYLQSDKNVRPLPFKSGDGLEILAFPDTGGFPSGFYPIDGEGYVDFPIIGYIKVIELSADTLAKILAEKYIDFMRYPYMRIRPAIRVSLNGGFYRPGLYWIDPHATLWEAIQTAGGTLRADGFRKLKWERNSLVLNDHLTPIIQEGKSLYQIGLQSGDQITIIQRPQQTNWDVFRSDILPVLTMTISTVVSAFTVYNSYLLYKRTQ